jgi:phage terminase small subunit
MPKSDKLTIRERKLLDNLTSGKFKHANEALIDAGYSESVANSRAKDVIGKPRFQEALQERMDKHDLTDDRLLRKLSAGIDAQKIISANVIIKTENGDEMKEADSMTKDFIEVDDWGAQYRFWKEAANMRGLIPKDKLDITVRRGADDLSDEDLERIIKSNEDK